MPEGARANFETSTYQDRPPRFTVRAIAWKAWTSGAGLSAGADLSATNFGEWAARCWPGLDLLATALYYNFLLFSNK